MMEFEIDSRVQPIGKREGQTVYFAKLKTQQKLTNQMVIERIVRETSLSEGDVKNALVSLSNIVCDALKRSLQDDGFSRRSHRGGRPQDPENHLHAQTEDARCRQCGGVEHRPGQERNGFRRYYHRA